MMNKCAIRNLNKKKLNKHLIVWKDNILTKPQINVLKMHQLVVEVLLNVHPKPHTGIRNPWDARHVRMTWFGILWIKFVWSNLPLLKSNADSMSNGAKNKESAVNARAIKNIWRMKRFVKISVSQDKYMILITNDAKEQFQIVQLDLISIQMNYDASVVKEKTIVTYRKQKDVRNTA